MEILITRKTHCGFALIAMMACLLVILMVFSGLIYWVTTNARQSARNQAFINSEAAAEGASEVIFSHLDDDYLYGNLGTTNSYLNLFPVMTNWPVQYAYNVYVNIGNQAPFLQPLGSEYAGLIGDPQTNVVMVTATPQNQLYDVPATVSQTFVFSKVPVFQFAIFYNINLEIDPGNTMPIGGPVFCNASIWSGTPNVTYSSTVEAVGQVNSGGTDPFMSGKTDSGTPQGNFQYSGPPPQPESNVNPLVLPIGAAETNNSATNIEAIINIPPPSVAAPLEIAYETTNQVYTFNEASLIVSNWYYGTNGVSPWRNNFTVYVQDNVEAALPSEGIDRRWVQLTNDYYIVTNLLTGKTFATNYVANFQFTNNVSRINVGASNYLWYAGFSFLTNATFYDQRESATVRAVQLDVGKLNAWITNAGPNGGSNWNQVLETDGHPINSIFIYNAVPFIGQSQLPGVRVMDGQTLPPYGLTVVTPQPLYVWGNYNVETNGGVAVTGSANMVNTYPAAFMADAITILSTNWLDTNSTLGLSSREPGNTTVNAACVEGIVPSVGSEYSGGVENFLRLLEDWGNGISGNTPTILTYNGSIIVMFPSEYATNVWPNTGAVYSVPQRDWSYDTNFLIEADLPPLTPNFRTVVRNSWSGY